MNMVTTDDLETQIRAMVCLSNLLCTNLDRSLDETQSKTTDHTFTFTLDEETVADIHFLAAELYLTAHRAREVIEAMENASTEVGH